MEKTHAPDPMAGQTSDPRLRILDEGLLSLSDAWRAAGLPRVCPKSLLRYSIAGHRGIRLGSIKAGGVRMTSVGAVRRFVAATQDAEPAPAVASIDAQAADRVLEAYGLGRDPQQPRKRGRPRKLAPGGAQ